MKVLILEDDRLISEGLMISMIQEGYEAVATYTVEDAMNIINSGEDIGFCLLDVMLPDGDGYTVCREIRKRNNVPVLFITACDDEIHTVLALEQGADDYITKPFRIRELTARMKAILRRTGASGQPGTVMVGENQVNIQSGKVYRGGEEIFLTAMEYKLLMIFINNSGKIISRQQILNALWDDAGNFVNDNTLTVYIKRLREKLGTTDENPVISTVRGLGYRLESKGVI